MFPAVFKTTKIFFLLTLASIILIFFDSFRFFDIPKSLLQNVTVPVQFGLYKSSQAVGRQFEFVLLARKSFQENKALNEQLAQVLSENADLRRRLAETQGFLDQQKSLDPRTYDLVPARPISISRYLIIDKGSSDGLKVGQPVVYKDTYVGQIKDISPKSSSVIFPSDPDSKLAAFVSSKDGRARGILSGQFGSDMLMDKVLHSEPVKQGDLVYSEGTEGNLPRGLVLGQVSDVMDRPNEIFKQAKVKSVFNISDLDIVFVITN